MSTLESEYTARVAAFRENAPSNSSHDAEVEFLLQIGPVIVQSMHNDLSVENDEAPQPLVCGSVMSSAVSTRKRSRGGTLLRNYLSEHDRNLTKKRSAREHVHNVPDSCAQCNEIFILDEVQSTLTCPKCAACLPYIDPGHSSYVYGSSGAVDSTPFAYKMITHFSEKLCYLQGLERTEIPDEDVEAVRQELRKRKIDIDPSVLDRKRLQPILRSMGKKFKKYYNHTSRLVYQLTGVDTAPKISESMKAQLYSMFDEATSAFESVRSTACPERRSFINYSYVFHKLLQLLEHDEMLVHFPLLKCSKKLYALDKIWKCICAHNRWEFIASV